MMRRNDLGDHCTLRFPPTHTHLDTHTHTHSQAGSHCHTHSRIHTNTQAGEFTFEMNTKHNDTQKCVLTLPDVCSQDLITAPGTISNNGMD